MGVCLLSPLSRTFYSCTDTRRCIAVAQYVQGEQWSRAATVSITYL